MPLLSDNSGRLSNISSAEAHVCERLIETVVDVNGLVDVLPGFKALLDVLDVPCNVQAPKHGTRACKLCEQGQPKGMFCLLHMCVSSAHARLCVCVLANISRKSLH